VLAAQIDDRNPASCAFKMPMTRSSANLLRFILVRSVGPEPTSNRMRGMGQYHHRKHPAAETNENVEAQRQWLDLVA
jgi:hypothetical protein